MTANGFRSCVLFQDIAIPAGATTLSLSGDFGIRTYGGVATGDTAIFVGLYPTTSVPSYQDEFRGGDRLIVPGFNVTALRPSGPVTLSVSSFAGTTVRLSVILAMQSPASGTGNFIPNAGAVMGASNIRAVATAPAPPAPPAPVPTMSEWAMIILGTLLAGGAALYIHRRQRAI